MQSLLDKFVLAHDFPCIMAQRVARKGRMTVHKTEDLSPTSVPEILRAMKGFISCYRTDRKLSSFILIAKDPQCSSFEDFEKSFWNFLESLYDHDRRMSDHDPRVKQDPDAPDFSFSVGGEAFFIIALHPLSPRRARRFPYPAIIFNPHEQFEQLRRKGIFSRIRNTIRRRDKKIQAPNPMLKDFGTRSETFQYLGKTYDINDPNPLTLKGFI